MWLGYKKIIFLHLLLCVILGILIIFFTKENQRIANQQNISLYYVNISGKQRILAQRIVYISQIITTNYILQRDNTNSFVELRGSINELLSIHGILKNFVIEQVVTDKKQSTLDDVYFGSGNLNFKIEAFLDGANRLFFLENAQEVLQINQMLVKQLEGDFGLLAGLELATLSQQIYGQNLAKMQTNYAQYFLYSGILIVFLQILLLFFYKNKKVSL
ncbi:MAG: hypothetical protein SOW25_02385 [Helicobacter sp.]|nr:hypothetical protein [Helicobacteraceae bacterium]MDY3113158.1 hypothetical protein [Helicobacter sp.]